MVPVSDQPIRGKIYFDTKRVHGVEFSYAGMTETQLIGSAKGGYVESEFSERSSFIGFYGETGVDRIQLLGFLVQDIPCSESS